MDKWLYHTVVLICTYLIVRKVKQAVTGLDFLAFILITVTFASRSFPFYIVCGLFVAAFTGALNVWSKHTCSTSCDNVCDFFPVCCLWFCLSCIFLHRILFQKVKFIICPFLPHLRFHVLFTWHFRERRQGCNFSVSSDVFSSYANIIYQTVCLPETWNKTPALEYTSLPCEAGSISVLKAAGPWLCLCTHRLSPPSL